MMLTTYQSLLTVHVVFGFLGLIAFWFPIFSKNRAARFTSAPEESSCGVATSSPGRRSPWPP